ncbi:MAG: sulfatase [Armatimonadota bacterium]
MLKRWWLFPLLLGIPAGVMTGILVCWMTPLCRLYADSHFYRLFTQTLAIQVDTYALMMTGIFAVLLLCLVAARRCPPRIEKTLQVVLPLVVLASAGKLFLPAQIWSALCRPLTDPAVLRYGGLILALGVLVGVLWRLRRKRSPAFAESPPPPIPRAHWGGAIIRKALLGLSSLFLLLFLSINLAAAYWWASSSNAVRRQPNVILVMVCSLRADHLGCYGYDLPTTPNLDRFAAESTRFAHAIAPSSWTLWSTASILTSRYPERIFHNTDYLADYAFYPSLPIVLSDLGYSTNAISSHPFFHNDDNFNYSQGFDKFVSLDSKDFTAKIAPQVTARALQRVKELKRQKFFLYAMYSDPHEPYTQHPEFVFRPSKNDTLDRQWTSTLPPAFQHMGADRLERLLVSNKADKDGRGESRQRRLAKYNSEIAYTDHAIGDLIDGLKKLNLYDDSLIIFCADHGEEFLEHGRYGHQYTLYPEVTNVPLLIKYPHQREGKVIDGRFPLIDLFPSILTMLHQENAHLGLQGEGVDVPPLLRCMDKPIYGATVNTVRSITFGQYKYDRGVKCIRDGTDPFEGPLSFHLSQITGQLFDLRTDPGEYRNTLTKQPDVAASLREIMRQHDAALDKQSTFSSSPLATSSQDTERARQQLKSLGYLQ